MLNPNQSCARSAFDATDRALSRPSLPLRNASALLRGTLVSQGRRCGKENCRCATGDLHGPYTYLSVPRSAGRPRMVYVSADLVDLVSGQVAATARIEVMLAEISAINAELLARRELS